MNVNRVLSILGKDLRLGPRSPMVLYGLLVPFVLTALIQVVFGSLFDPQPRLGIVDRGASGITAALAGAGGIELSRLDDEAELRSRLASHDLDAGLVLSADFDDRVRAGARPPLELFVGGQARAADRIVLAVTALDLIRRVEGSPPPVEVTVTPLGSTAVPIAARLTPLLVMYALIIVGVYLPALSLAEEQAHGTLLALSVTPARLGEVVAAKGIAGFVLGGIMSLVTLWLNGALRGGTVPLAAAVLLAAGLCAQLGLIYGTAAKDPTALYALMKGTGFLLIGPTVFYVFPHWPQWIPKLLPTYWIINPIFEVTLNGARFDDVWGELAAAAGIIAALCVPVAALTRRLSARLAAG